MYLCIKVREIIYSFDTRHCKRCFLLFLLGKMLLSEQLLFSSLFIELFISLIYLFIIKRFFYYFIDLLVLTKPHLRDTFF